MKSVLATFGIPLYHSFKSYTLYSEEFDTWGKTVRPREHDHGSTMSLFELLGWLSLALAPMIAFSQTTPAPVPNTPAVDCGKCQNKITRFQALRKKREKHIALLGDNHRYLAGLSAAQASKFLKVQSNIHHILKGLDQIKKDLEASEKDLIESGCLQCPEANKEVKGAD